MRDTWQKIRTQRGTNPVLTVEDLRKTHDDVFQAWIKKNPNAAPSSQTRKVRDTLSKRLGVIRRGVRFGEPPIFNVDMSNYNQSGLHYQIGTSSGALNHLKAAIRKNLQVNTAAEDKLYSALEKAEEAHLKACEAVTEAETSMSEFDDVGELKDVVKAKEMAVTAAKEELEGDKKNLIYKQQLNQKNDAWEKAKKRLEAAEAKAKKIELLQDASEAAKEKVEVAVTNLEKEFEKKGVREGPCLTILREVLEEHKVFQEGMHGGTVPGNSSRRLCEDAQEIFDKLRRRLRREGVCKAGVDGNAIDKMLYPYDELLRHLDICCKILRSTEEQTDEAIETFVENVNTFGELWRKITGTAIPKVHCMETHCVDQLEYWGTIGGFDENVLEGFHKEHNNSMRIVNGLKDYEKRETYLHQRLAAMTNEEVVELGASVEGQRKRKFSAASILRRKERMRQTDNELLVKVEALEKFVDEKAYKELIDLTED